MSETRSKLEGEILPAEWKMLAMHQRRDALFIVDDTLTLLDVAVAVAEDDSAAVERWVTGGLLTRPTPEAIARWESEDGPQFLCAIVQPFVLAQRLSAVPRPEAEPHSESR